MSGPTPPPNIEQGRTKDQLPASTQYFVEFSHDIRKQSREHAKDYGLFCLRLLSIAHGGAIAALLGFFGNWSSTRTEVSEIILDYFRPAFIAFSFGLIVVLFCSFFAYLNWSLHSKGERSPAETLEWLRKGQSGKKAPRGIQTTYWIAVSLGILSGILFLVGAALVVLAV